MKKLIASLAILVLLVIPTLVSAQVGPRVWAVEAGQKQPSQFEIQHTKGISWVTFTATVTLGDRVYRLETQDNRGQLEVGQEYQVVKLEKGKMELLIPGKKGTKQISFNVVSVSLSPKEK